MASKDIEILVHHDFLNSLNPRPLARRLAHNQRTMLSYSTSSPRPRVDGGIYATTTPVKEGAGQLIPSNPSPMSHQKDSPSYRLPLASTNNDQNTSRTYRDREEVRDDTIAQVNRTEWNHQQTRRYQASPPPSFQPQIHHDSSMENRANHQYQHVGDGAWTTSQTAAHQAASQARRLTSWSGYRPAFHRAHSDTEADARYHAPAYPVMQNHHNEGYAMLPYPRSTSFEQQRPPQEQRFLLHSQATPPIRRYEDHQRREYVSRVPTERPREARSPYTQVQPELRFKGHADQTVFDWRAQHAAFHAQRMMSNQSDGMPLESYQQQARMRNQHTHYESAQQVTVGRNASTEMDANLAQSSSSSREWHGPNIGGNTKPTPMAVEANPSEHSDESSSSTAGLMQDDPPPMKERAGDGVKRFIESSFGYRPVISEDSAQSCEPAPPKRMRPAYDQRSNSATGSLELLCSATLDLGPLQDNATGCSCPRSNCIKLYCDCFKAGRRCSSKCSCTNCKNTPAESGVNGERTRAIKNILSRNPRAFTGGKKEAAPRKPGDLICNCVKSRCLKLYCECFQKGKLCNDSCSCVSCLNTQEESEVGGRRKMAIQQALEKRPDAFTKKPKEIGSGCACKNNR